MPGMVQAPSCAVSPSLLCKIRVSTTISQMKTLSPEKCSDVPKAEPGSQSRSNFGVWALLPALPQRVGLTIHSPSVVLCSGFVPFSVTRLPSSFTSSSFTSSLEPSVLPIAVPVVPCPSNQPPYYPQFSQTAFGLCSSRQDILVFGRLWLRYSF